MLTLGQALLQELRMQEGDCSFLAPDLQEVLKITKQTRKQAQPKHDHQLLRTYTGVLKDLFVDWQRFNGVASVKHRVLQLDSLLQNKLCNSSLPDQRCKFCRMSVVGKKSRQRWVPKHTFLLLTTGTGHCMSLSWVCHLPEWTCDF